MTSRYHEDESLAEMSGWIAMFGTEQELGTALGVYPSILEGFGLEAPSFIHEGRRVIPEIHGDDLPDQIYQLDGCFALEFEEG